MNNREQNYPNDGFQIVRFNENGRMVWGTRIARRDHYYHDPGDADDDEDCETTRDGFPTYEERDGYSLKFWKDLPPERCGDAGGDDDGDDADGMDDEDGDDGDDEWEDDQ